MASLETTAMMVGVSMVLLGWSMVTWRSVIPRWWSMVTWRSVIPRWWSMVPWWAMVMPRWWSMVPWWSMMVPTTTTTTPRTAVGEDTREEQRVTGDGAPQQYAGREGVSVHLPALQQAGRSCHREDCSHWALGNTIVLVSSAAGYYMIG